MRRRIDVAAAFGETEKPTRPAVHELVPLDAVPVLAVQRADLPWEELGELATQLLLRIDGRASAMEIVTGHAFAPRECATELAALARRGLLRLLPVVAPATKGREDEWLEIDLTAL
jgi:hypothetical protein